MHSWGLNDAEGVVATLGVKRDLHGCAIALLGMHRVFGIKSKIFEETGDQVTIHATKCMWKEKKGWTSEVVLTQLDYHYWQIHSIQVFKFKAHLRL